MLSQGFLNSQVNKQNEWEFLPRQHLFLHFDPFPLPPQEVLQHLGSMQLGTRASPCRSTHLKIANPGRVLWRYKGLQHSKTEFRMTNVCINWLSHEFLKLWGTEGDSTHPPFFPILKNSLMHHMTLAS